jgi:hypothetical protein
MSRVKKKDKRHPMQFKSDMWEGLELAAIEASEKAGRLITVPQFIREHFDSFLKRKGFLK